MRHRLADPMKLLGDFTSLPQQLKDIVDDSIVRGIVKELFIDRVYR